MAKRKIQDFDRRANDAYFTPPEAIYPLAEALAPCRFIEPCAGDGGLAETLTRADFTCVAATDLNPADPSVARKDALSYRFNEVQNADAIITNPPFKRDLLLPILDHFLMLEKEMVLLLPLDVIANLWFAPYSAHVGQILPIGRVRWIPGSPSMSMENFAWVALSASPEAQPFLLPRRKKITKGYIPHA